MAGGIVAENSSVCRSRGQLRDDLPHVVDEAHVEHPVGLVEHEDFDAGEVERAAPDVVEQAARRGDDDVDAALERLELRPHPDAAEDGDAAEAGVLAVRADGRFDLDRELPRRGDDEGADGPPLRRGGLRGEAVEHRAARRRPSCRCRSARSR